MKRLALLLAVLALTSCAEDEAPEITDKTIKSTCVDGFRVFVGPAYYGVEMEVVEDERCKR